MTICADASALLTLYPDEPESAVARRTLRTDPTWISRCIGAVEVPRTLRRLLDGDAPRRGSLDAFHLATAVRVGAAEDLPIVAFDRRLAAAARTLGWRFLPE